MRLRKFFCEMQFRRPHWAEREKRVPVWLLAGAAPASSRRPGRGRSRLVLASIRSQVSRTADRTGAEASSLSFARRAVAVPECLGSHPNEALRLMEEGPLPAFAYHRRRKGRRNCFAFRLQRPRAGSPRRGDWPPGRDLNRIINPYSNVAC